jgi:hypothetical protein
MSNFIQAFADAITRQEGYFPGSTAYNNNNPGNIWDGVAAGKPNRIWPNLPTDPRGFVIYPTAAAGRAALENDLTIKMNSGLSLNSAIAMYAPPNENSTVTYQTNVASWLGVDGSQSLRSLAASWTGSGSAPVSAVDYSAANSGVVDPLALDALAADASALDPGAAAMPLVIGGAVLLAAAAWLWG